MIASDLLVSIFDQTAKDYDRVGILPRLASENLLNRLEDFHHFTPQNILDLGCGTGFCLQQLYTRYPAAHITGIDWSYPLLQTAKTTLQSFSTSITYVQADIQTLPFRKKSFDFICANLSLLWIKDLAQYLTQLKEYLKPGGLLLFAGLGIDTFKELENTTSLYPWGFTDMHTLGDILAAAKWQDVVMDVDRFLVKYSNIQAFYIELQQLGLHSLLAEYTALQEVKETTPQEKCNMTWEVIYGQAWHIEQGDRWTNNREVSIPVSQVYISNISSSI